MQQRALHYRVVHSRGCCAVPLAAALVALVVCLVSCSLQLGVWHCTLSPGSIQNQSRCPTAVVLAVVGLGPRPCPRRAPQRQLTPHALCRGPRPAACTNNPGRPVV